MGVQFFVPVDAQTIAVSGQSTLADTLVSTLAASGQSTLADTSITALIITDGSGVSGGLVVTGTPGVSGETILGGDLVVNGSVVMDGVVDMDQHLTVGGLVTANGGLTVCGATIMDSVTTISGAMSTIGGNITVNGESTLNQVIVDSTLTVSGDTSVAKLSASGLVSLSGGFAITNCIPTVPAPSSSSDGLQIATTAWVKDVIQTLIGVDTNAAISLQALSATLAADTTAGGIATFVTTEANRASTAADDAETSYSNTVTKANNALTSANNASSSATEAANSAAAALAAVAGIVDDDSAYATLATPVFTGNVTLSSGSLFLESTTANQGSIVFAAKDGGGDYHMGVDSGSPSDKLVIKKGTQTLMAISDSGFSGGTPGTETVTFNAPVVMTDLLDLKDCTIKLSPTQGITASSLVSFIQFVQTLPGAGIYLTTLL